MHSNLKAIWVHIQSETLHFTSLAVLDRVGFFVVFCGLGGLVVWVFFA